MRTVAVALISALIGGGVAAGIVVAVDDDAGPGETRTIVQQAPLAQATGSGGDGARGLTPAEIYRRAAPGVVYITASVVERSQSPFDLFPRERRGESTGTGFVIDREGAILTNAHVVERAQTVSVRFKDGKEVRATVRGLDASTDIALLKVDPKGLDLQPLELGSAEDVEVGDATVAIGNPYGLDLTLTTGVISAKHRRIEAPNGFQIEDVLQTDAAINPGNSGGPLIDATGRVIGINSQIRTSSDSGGNIGIGFAVPIDTAKRILPELREHGAVERAYLGVSTVSVTPELNLRVDRGAYVSEVVPGSPADEAGIRPGDIIVRFDGRAVRTNEDVTARVEARRPGDRVTVEVVRGGERTTLKVKLGRRPDTVGS